MNETEIKAKATRTATEILALEEEKLDRIRAEERKRIRDQVEKWRDEALERSDKAPEHGSMCHYNGRAEAYETVLNLINEKKN